MARPARVVINRQALLEVDLALLESLEHLAQQMLDETTAPDAPPIGQGLVQRGSVVSYVAGKRVGGTVTKKPKRLKVRGQGVVLAVGWPFPARFSELGTETQPGRPFFFPVVMRLVPRAPGIVGPWLRRLMPKPRGVR